MAFRTNKVPVLQTKSASGAVATFNTALAMPLASCSIAVNAWQEGSGDPSPSNVRAIHGFSVVNATANEFIHTIQLGQEVYGAEVDVVNGVARIEYGLVDLGSLSWTYFPNTAVPHFGAYLPEMKDKTNNILCSIFKVSTSHYGNDNLTIRTSDEHSKNGIKASWTDYTVASDFKNAVRGGQFLFELAEPFDIQLTPTQIATIRGNNTIFADTGDIDLTYKDLDIAKRGNFREVFKLPS